VIRIDQEFETEEAAETFVARYYGSFHPMGYGTHLVIYEPCEEPRALARKDKWRVLGSRSESCD
jgi:hypothetical protein